MLEETINAKRPHKRGGKKSGSDTNFFARQLFFLCAQRKLINSSKAMRILQIRQVCRKRKQRFVQIPLEKYGELKNEKNYNKR